MQSREVAGTNSSPTSVAPDWTVACWFFTPPDEELGSTILGISRMPCAPGTIASEPIIWHTVLIVNVHGTASVACHSQLIDDIGTSAKILCRIFQLEKELRT